MLQSKALASSHWLVLCVALCAITTIHSQNRKIRINVDKYIEVHAKNKNHYFIKNISGIKLGIRGTNREGTVYIKPNKVKYFSNKESTAASIITVSCDLEQWEERFNYYAKVYQWHKTVHGATGAIDSLLHKLGRFGNQSKGNEEEREKEFKRRRDYKEIKHELKIAEIQEKFEYYGYLYDASHNEKYSVFEPIQLMEVLEKDPAHYDAEINLKNIFYLGIGVTRSGLGDNWDGDSKLTQNISFDFNYARRIWKGFDWGAYTSLYAFVGYDGYTHDILNEEQQFFLSREYISNPTQDFYAVTSENGINLRTNQMSGGLLLRTYFFGALSVDIGAGYYFADWSILNFNDKNEDDERIEHISGANLIDNRFKDVLENDSDPIYGVLNLGWTFLRPKDKWNLGVYVLGKFWQRDLSPSNEFQIFQQTNGNFEKISITDGKELFYTANSCKIEPLIPIKVIQ